MSKIMIKLAAAGASLALALTVVLMSTYAWFTLSTSPTVSGIQMTIGDNTIRVAADMTVEKDGSIYHYPGAFSDTLNFSAHESYRYLQNINGLSPVSTADGIHWFMPPGSGDPEESFYEVQMDNGSISRFVMDNTLAYANRTGQQDDASTDGHYACLDFWVVAPGGNYTLRVSATEDSGGSYLVDLPAAAADGPGSYVLQDPTGTVSAIGRVGFLVNSDKLEDDSMLLYQQSRDCDKDYKMLRGSYPEAGEAASPAGDWRFTIYEPNGDYHPEHEDLAGSYVQTLPIGMAFTAANTVSVMERTAVQKYTAWQTSSDGTERVLDQMFKTYLMQEQPSGLTGQQVTDRFYNDYLVGQIRNYLETGDFITRTSALDGQADAEAFGSLAASGATEDVYIIQLERNVPQRIRMFVWLEGQDVDCTGNAGVSSFALSIELAGGST